MANERSPEQTILITLVEESIQKWIEASHAKIDVRLDAMDKATNLLHQDFVRVPTDMDRSIKHLHDLVQSQMNAIKEGMATLYRQWEQRQEVLNERFADRDRNIAIIFSERDKRAEALMRAQLDAITKMENNFTKLIEQGAETGAAGIKGVTDSLNDVKSRLDRGEGHFSGIGSSWGILIGAAGIVVAIFTVAHFWH